MNRTKSLGQIALDAYRKAWDQHKPCLNNEDWEAAAAAVREAVLKEVKETKGEAAGVHAPLVKPSLPLEQMRGLPLFEVAAAHQGRLL
jgi:hypothetical protein